MTSGLRFAAMTDADLDAVLALEAHSFDDPWTAEHFRGELANRHSHPQLLWSGDELVGYIVYWLIIDELEILNVAIAPRLRRQGLGRTLVDYVIETALDANARHISLEVRRSNVAAIALYTDQGFAPIAVRKGYYAARKEDAIVMRRDL